MQLSNKLIINNMTWLTFEREENRCNFLVYSQKYIKISYFFLPVYQKGGKGCIKLNQPNKY